MARRFISPPNWPLQEGWTPHRNWKPNSSWGPAPEGWVFWEEIPEEALSEAESHAVVTNEPEESHLGDIEQIDDTTNFVEREGDTVYTSMRNLSPVPDEVEVDAVESEHQHLNADSYSNPDSHFGQMPHINNWVTTPTPTEEFAPSALDPAVQNHFDHENEAVTLADNGDESSGDQPLTEQSSPLVSDAHPLPYENVQDPADPIPAQKLSRRERRKQEQEVRKQEQKERRNLRHSATQAQSPQNPVPDAVKAASPDATIVTQVDTVTDSDMSDCEDSVTYAQVSMEDENLAELMTELPDVDDVPSEVHQSDHRQEDHSEQQELPQDKIVPEGDSPDPLTSTSLEGLAPSTEPEETESEGTVTVDSEESVEEESEVPTLVDQSDEAFQTESDELRQVDIPDSVGEASPMSSSAPDEVDAVASDAVETDVVSRDQVAVDPLVTENHSWGNPANEADEKVLASQQAEKDADDEKRLHAVVGLANAVLRRKDVQKRIAERLNNEQVKMIEESTAKADAKDDEERKRDTKFARISSVHLPDGVYDVNETSEIPRIATELVEQYEESKRLRELPEDEELTQLLDQAVREAKSLPKSTHRNASEGVLSDWNADENLGAPMDDQAPTARDERLSQPFLHGSASADAGNAHDLLELNRLLRQAHGDMAKLIDSKVLWTAVHRQSMHEKLADIKRLETEIVNAVAHPSHSS